MKHGMFLKVLLPVAALVFFSQCRTVDLTQSKTEAADASPLYSNSIKTIEEFEAFATEGGGLILGGRSMKFFVDQRNASAKKIYFINGNFKERNQTPYYAKYHYDFGRKTLNILNDISDENERIAAFNSQTYFTQNKSFVAGTIRTYVYQDRTIFGIQLYVQDYAKEAVLLDILNTVTDAFTLDGVQKAFVSTGAQQTTNDPNVASKIAEKQLLNLTLENILGSINYIPMNLGEAWGTLRLYPISDDDLSATDIPVFKELPLDLTVVAGVITQAFQDTNSHINLKSKERKTPNMVLRKLEGRDDLSFWNGKPVHISVEANGYKIEATSEQVVQQKLAERINKPWQSMDWIASTRLLTYDEMCPARAADCIAYAKKVGSKAANLGFMRNRSVLGTKTQPGTFSQRLGYDLVPVGFGIPLQFYKDFVDLPANADLKRSIADMNRREKEGSLTGAQRLALSNSIKAMFYRATVPPQHLLDITAKVKELTTANPNLKKFKFRSSANAEDIEGFDGAGLYNSFTVNIKKSDNPDLSCEEVPDDEEVGGEAKTKMKPNTINCGIKGVYASLWNRRAIDERTFARIDPDSVAMGIGVVPRYDAESEVVANTVVVTRVINSEDVYGYSLSIQKDNNLVTNPDPGTFSEVTIASFTDEQEKIAFTTTRYAKPAASGTPLKENVLKPKVVVPTPGQDHNSDANLKNNDPMVLMVKISRAVEKAFCRYKPGYYPDAPDSCPFVIADPAKPKSIDMEFKVLGNGEFVSKQVREFSGK